MTAPPISFSRAQILAFRRWVGALDQRLPSGEASLRQAAWAGLQDSVPRSALLSIHARVEGTASDSWEHPSLVQVWGPRFCVFVVARADLAALTLGRLPTAARGRRRALELAGRLDALLAGRRMLHGEAEEALGLPPNMLRYAAATGTVLIRWDGARQPTLWTTAAPEVEAAAAREDLARRYLHVYGPATADAFARWADVGRAEAATTFRTLAPDLLAVGTPIGDGWVLASDEQALLAPPRPPAAARLLPSGDPYYLLWGPDRQLLVPDEAHRQALWTSRVWPGAVLVQGEVAGTWRRNQAAVEIAPWRRLSTAERDAVAREATSLPLPGGLGPAAVHWAD